MLTAAAVSRKSVTEDRSQRGTSKPITRPLSLVPKLDEDVLAQLPEDIRLEVIANREEHLCIAEYDTTLEKMEKVLGKKLGQNLFQNCRGIDDRPLAYEQVGVQILLRPTYLFLVPYFSFRSAKPFPPK